MSLFADYIQPLTGWLQTNPNWALFITFIIALTESLAIIGSIIPGSVTMTAIGILAGSGIMRLDLTLIAATIGAVCGDSLSYALGYFYSERLADMWPFTKYPKWLTYGKNFFAHHGGKSVLIGRFVGPLRSLIPVIAGILHMQQWRFLLANVISAIGWSLLYVMPGALIGAASNGLSAESATRLFLLILIILAVIWLASLLIKWIFLKLNSFLKGNLHHFWLKFKNNSKLRPLYNAITPSDELNHYPTAALALLTLFCLLFFITLLILSIQNQWLGFINMPIHLFLQSFHTPLLNAFFIIITQLISTITIISMYIICIFVFIHHKHIKSIFYLTSIIIVSCLVSFILAYSVNSQRPVGLLIAMPGSSFPVLDLVVATAFYSFILFYINNKFTLLTSTIKTFILIVLGLCGFGAIFLGDVWFTDVIASYFIGVSICLIHYLLYRKSNLNYLKSNQPIMLLFILIIGMLSSMAVSTYLNFNILARNHTSYHNVCSLTETAWWNQQKPVLPLYRVNRIGKKISMLNIQYVGNLNELETSLEKMGWKSHHESFFTKLLILLSNNSSEVRFPLLAQLYENKPPELIMTYKDKQSQLILELNFWESNYITELHKPIWIGTIHQNIRSKNKKINQASLSPQQINSLSYLIPSLTNFTLRRIALPPDTINPTLFPTTATILLIKSP